MQKDKKNYKLRKFGPITERRDYSITNTLYQLEIF